MNPNKYTTENIPIRLIDLARRIGIDPNIDYHRLHIHENLSVVPIEWDAYEDEYSKYNNKLTIFVGKDMYFIDPPTIQDYGHLRKFVKRVSKLTIETTGLQKELNSYEELKDLYCNAIKDSLLISI